MTIDLDQDIRDKDAPVQLVLVLSHIKFKQLVAYPVIVEAWDKVKSGKAKREWLKQFTEEDRARIAYYQKKFYDWYLVTGAPMSISVKSKNITLLQRAVDFFASI